jgi:hypothetical protein
MQTLITVNKLVEMFGTPHLVAPYGEHCIAIPSDQFQQDWEQQLNAQGCECRHTTVQVVVVKVRSRTIILPSTPPPLTGYSTTIIRERQENTQLLDHRKLTTTYGNCKVCGKPLFVTQFKYCSSRCRRIDTAPEHKNQKISFRNLKSHRKKLGLDLKCGRCKEEITEDQEYVRKRRCVYHKTCYDSMRN